MYINLPLLLKAIDDSFGTTAPADFIVQIYRIFAEQDCTYILYVHTYLVIQISNNTYEFT